MPNSALHEGLALFRDRPELAPMERGVSRTRTGGAGEQDFVVAEWVPSREHKCVPSGLGHSDFVNLTADEYRWAALARIGAAERLHAAAMYASAIYLAGVAVECILRAYRVRVDPAFDSRHDLRHLLSASGLQDYVPEKRRAEVAAALGDVWARWRNDYRYASDERVLRDLRDRGLTLGIRGDALKDNSRRVFEKAHELVGMGVAQWNNG